MKSRSVQERLADKDVQTLLVNHFKAHYHYSPAMAEAILRDTVFTRTLLDPQTREDGQVIRHLPRSTESAGKPLARCELAAVRLTLYAKDDDAYRLEHGLKALRWRKIKRLADESAAQGSPITQEDLASLLGCDRSTIVRDLAEMRAQGITVVTRGDFTDQGPGVSHKEPIIKMRLLGVMPSEVARRTGHDLSCVEAYISDFLRIACTHREGKPPAAICRLTKLSLGLVSEYLALYERLAQDQVCREPLDKMVRFYSEGLLPDQKGGSR
ncbi:MAG: DUF1670 domain-containing protein [Planctomycetota bacterium]